MSTTNDKIIIPTIGRRVWFRPDPRSGASGFVCHDSSVPMDAGIVYVWSDRMVNLDVCDHAGNHHAFTSVPLVHSPFDAPPDGHYCEWMPFQKGQAKVDPPRGRAEWAKVYGDGTVATGPAPLPELSPAQIEGRGLLSFGSALDLLKHGAKVARLGWNGKGMWLELQSPDINSKMTLPYIFLNYPAGATYPEGARVPWLASQTDMLADDWVVVE